VKHKSASLKLRMTEPLLVALEVVLVMDSLTCGNGLTVPESGRADRGRWPRLSGFCSQPTWIWPCFDQWTARLGGGRREIILNLN